MDDDDKEYLPSAEALGFLEEVEQLDKFFQPFSYKKKATQKHGIKKKKQMTLKKAVRNMRDKTEKNWQGFAIDKCTIVPGMDVCVYIPKKYGKNINNERAPFCNHCFLKPCSVAVFGKEIGDLCDKVGPTAEDTSELVERLRFRYRALIKGVYNKSYVTKYMKDNASIPQCALRETSLLAELAMCPNDEESLVNDSPTSRDRVLNARDNRRERDCMREPARDLLEELEEASAEEEEGEENEFA